LGEGLFNDVVVIVLYQTVKEYQEDNDKAMTTKSAFTIIGSFIELCILSVAVGVSMGFIITYVLKRCRYVSHSAI
jgi:NhaP-type Na+/H+ or K+/H+ antiporter